MPYVYFEDSRLFYHFYYTSVDHDCEIHVKFTWTYHDFVVTSHMAVQHERRTFLCGPTAAGKTF